MSKQKQQIKYIYVTRGSRATKTCKMSMLTVDNQYIEFEMVFIQKALTANVAVRLRSLFCDYAIMPSTEVLVDSKIRSNDIMIMYFQLLKQHIPFIKSIASSQDMLSRILTYHTSIAGVKKTTVTMYTLNKVWKWMVKSRKCPWITYSVDAYLKDCAPHIANDVKRLRLAIYYMAIKTYYRNRNASFAARKLKSASKGV